jgi:hypothetical protein
LGLYLGVKVDVGLGPSMMSQVACVLIYFHCIFMAGFSLNYAFTLSLLATSNVEMSHKVEP